MAFQRVRESTPAEATKVPCSEELAVSATIGLQPSVAVYQLERISSTSVWAEGAAARWDQ